MRLRWLFLFTIALGLLVGPIIKDIPGFVVIAIGNYTMQTRLWQVIVIMMILAILFILGYHLLVNLLNSAGKLKIWSGGRRWQKSRKQTINGMIALAEGDWKNAEKRLTKAALDSDTPLVNFLAAAQAAQAQKEDVRRDTYLRQAQLAEPNAEIAVGLTQAQLQLNHGQYEQALATLTHLKTLAPKHDHVLWLLQKLYRRLGDWQSFLDMAPQLKKSVSLSAEALRQYQLLAWQNLLIRSAAKSGIEALHSLWLQIPKQHRAQVILINCYCELLLHHGAHLEVEKILRTNISKLGDENLLYLYGKVHADDPGKQLAFAEGLNKKFSGNAIWLLTLGRICLNNTLWGKAKNYLEQSLALVPSPETYLELARSYEALGETDSAIDCYRQGLKDAIEKTSSSQELAEIPFGH
ncbi:MAG: heme biosynthesis protein HemY [Gammaproteobacteria bacterium]|nr:MAG: heme biosynthesis protein HemY [Gammaproteobacteria bacterium]